MKAIDGPDGPDGYEPELDWRFWVRLSAASVLLLTTFSVVFLALSLIGGA